MNPTETPLLTAKRELQEETGIEADLSSLHYLGKFYVRYPNGDFIFHLFQTFVEKDFKGVILSDEHEAYGLYTPEELRSLPLTPGLDECINLALQNQP
jgi:8-oxo-dGTP pyrophosphatase MutT (NUDIX family)